MADTRERARARRGEQAFRRLRRLSVERRPAYLRSLPDDLRHYAARRAAGATPAEAAR